MMSSPMVRYWRFMLASVGMWTGEKVPQRKSGSVPGAREAGTEGLFRQARRRRFYRPAPAIRDGCCPAGGQIQDSRDDRCRDEVIGPLSRPVQLEYPGDMAGVRDERAARVALASVSVDDQ